MRRAARVAALWVALGLVAFAPCARAQVVPPNGHWRTIATKHFRVSYQEGLEAQARRAAAQAEIAYAKLAQHLHKPRGVIDIVVADNVDFSNGSTTIFPTNRIILYALPPLDVPSLEFYNGWWEEIETHELTHSFHLDRTAGWWKVGQAVFGRAPLLFPNAYEPSWITEGLAVYYESTLTDAGRINGTVTSMIVRSTAQRNALPYWDTWSLATTEFPYGNIAYDYGAEFLDYLAGTRGPATLGAFVERASRRPIPFTYNGAAEGAFGISYAAAWHRWHDSLAVETHALASPDAPVAGWHDLGAGELYALRPRWNGDGSLVYAGNLGKSFTAGYALDAAGMRRSLGRRNSSDTQVPLADGGILFAQLEYGDPYHVRSDLYIERAGVRTRLTHGARLAQPDARGDGAIVAVRYEPGTTALVRVSADGRAITPLTTVAADTEWAEPRWSPNGALIAATRWTRGAYADVVVLDSTGRLVRAFTHDRAFDASPSWSPDGRSVLFTSNRTGNQNVYVAVLADSAPPRKLTSSTTGMFYPSLSPDGRTLAAVRYDADGDHIGLAPFDTAGALPAPLDSSFIAAPYLAAVADSSPSRAYSPFPGLWPHYWLPAIGVNTLNGITLGAYTGGSDIIGRHTYFAQALFDLWHYQNTFDFGYAYAGLGQPIVTMQGTQYWDQFPIGAPDSSGIVTVGDLFRRTREIDLGLTVRRLRYYSTAFATLSGGYQEKSYTSSPDTLLPHLPSYYSSDPRFWLLGASVGYANAVTPIIGVSPEDGISTVLVGALKWHEGDSGLWSESIQGSFSAFVALGHGGFAHPVLRARGAAGISDGSNAGLFDLGGVSGGGVVLLPGVTLGYPRFFPVRGFAPGVESGTRAIAGTAELVLPVAALHRGFGFFPLFLDRSSLTLFADGGSAWYTTTAGGASAYPIASVGAELTVFVGVPYDTPYSLRIGVAAPVVNHSGTAVPAATIYLTLGAGR
jgi:hypothetical protein